MPIAMFYNNGAGYTHCRSGSDSVIHRRSSAVVGLSRDVDAFDSGDSTLSDVDGKFSCHSLFTSRKLSVVNDIGIHHRTN